jgi:peptide chain release factor 2
LTQEKSRFESEIQEFQDLSGSISDAETLYELAEEEGDGESLTEAIEQISILKEKFEKIEFRKLLSAPEDPNNAILTINAGAGGTESMDWAHMLLRMYHRWAHDHGFKFDIVDYQAGDEAGIKSATVNVQGDYAYGRMKSEAGVHRLVRISPFDSNQRRHTSFTSVFVSPEIDDSFEVEINPADLRIDVFRSGGKGGQSVNTTDSAVRIVHNPSGLVVTCQNERSQLQNKATAMKVLKSRLYEKHLEEKRAEQQGVEDAKKEIAWGSQIRSYVLHPYKMVKDHRTGFTLSSAEKTLDGDLDGFMKAYLECRFKGEWSKGGGDDAVVEV